MYINKAVVGVGDESSKTLPLSFRNCTAQTEHQFKASLFGRLAQTFQLPVLCLKGKFHAGLTMTSSLSQSSKTTTFSFSPLVKTYVEFVYIYTCVYIYTNTYKNFKMKQKEKRKKRKKK
jgi:large-conductance mechanosensitive channel